MGFYDFAGSILVHAVGGFAGLAGAIVLGPRLGRFVDGKAQPMPGHSLTFASLGTFILVVGWFGFNPGSQLAIVGAGNTDAVALIATNTALTGCYLAHDGHSKIEHVSKWCSCWSCWYHS
jgi:Amt family ammonium transporter